MARNKTNRSISSSVPGVILILMLAGALTYGSKIVVAEATKPKPAVTKTVVVVDANDKEDADEAAAAEAAAQEAAKKSAANKTAAEQAAAATPAPATPTATTNSFVYLRPGAAATGTPLQDLQAGTVVQYETVTPGLWQKVTVNGVTGYVYKKWLTY